MRADHLVHLIKRIVPGPDLGRGHRTTEALLKRIDELLGEVPVQHVVKESALGLKIDSHAFVEGCD
jgi:hypothetical protein